MHLAVKCTLPAVQRADDDAGRPPSPHHNGHSLPKELQLVYVYKGPDTAHMSSSAGVGMWIKGLLEVSLESCGGRKISWSFSWVPSSLDSFNILLSRYRSRKQVCPVLDAFWAKRYDRRYLRDSKSPTGRMRRVA